MTSTDLVVRAQPPAAVVINGEPLAQAAQRYLAFKKKRLTAASERSYTAALKDFAEHYPNLGVTDFEPPRGSGLIDDFLIHRYGHLAGRTYNRGLSVITDFMRWLYARGELDRDPTLVLERAKQRQVLRFTFTDEQRARILAANPDPREQVALRLLLDYGLRKGALRNVQLQHFDGPKRRLTIFTKGEKIFTLPIPDPAVWTNLELLAGADTDYLLPKITTRKRTAARREELDLMREHLAEIIATVPLAAADEHSARELGALLTTLDYASQQLHTAAEAATTRTRLQPALQCGEHGTHLWWYRCLTRAGVVEPGTTRGKKMHAARHTAGQRVLEKTGNLKAAQALLCHANISTTGDNYTGWDDHQLEQTMREVIPA